MKMIKKGDYYFPSKELKNSAALSSSKIYQIAKKNPVKFWEKLAKELFWVKTWKKAFRHEPPYFKWFIGGKTNITLNIFEKNKLGWEKIKNKVAIIWEPEPLEEKPSFLTFGQLFKKVCQLANFLKKLGVKKGDRVAIYLPMIPEAIISMLACARVGAIHTVVFSAFSPEALRARILDAKAKVLITADGYYRRGKIINLKENADQGVAGTSIEKVIVVKRAKNQIPWQAGRDYWFDEIEKEEKYCKAEVMDSEETMFILYTSGSTGKPKGCVHVCGGYLVQSFWTGRWIFDFKEDSILWSTADIGWITGHTYTVYSPLLNGVTTILFEGAPDWPTPDRWAQIIEKYDVTIFYTAPTAIRMFIKYGEEVIKNYKFNSLRILGSVGEPIDEESWLWFFKNVGKERCPIVDTWWQTETGGILITSLPGIGPFKPAHTGLPLPGIKVEILDDKGKKCKPGESGNLVLLPPFAPSLVRQIYGDPKKYQENYFSQYGPEIYFTSDGALRDKKGLIRILGRVDDVIKVAGHRISTGELENVLTGHPQIVEAAVVGINDEIKGQVPVAFIVTKPGVNVEKVKEEAILEIRNKIGPIALPKEVYVVEDLPKTRSGKIMRRILRKLFTGEDLGDLSTLANPESVEKIKEAIKK